MRSVIIHEKGRTFDPVIGSMAFPGSVSPDAEGSQFCTPFKVNPET
jgi:hypothetical protein